MSDDIEQTEDVEPPEMTSYTVTLIRQIEVDLSEKQKKAILQQTDSDSVADALEQVRVGQERTNVEPEEKLLGVNAEVEEAD